MNRIGKRAAALVMAIALGAGSVPGGVERITAEEKKGQLRTDLLNSVEQTDTPKYREGQAVVMYQNSDRNGLKKALAKTDFGEKITIESTCKFVEPSKSGKITSQSVKAKTGWNVSLVSSTTYTTKELIAQLKKQENVLYAEPNYVVHADTADYGKYLWGLDNQGQNGGTPHTDTQIGKIDVSQYDNSSEKVVAIIDTGVDYTHEELQGAMWNNPYGASLKGEHGYDFANWDKDPMDDNGHGTHCAGIIAGCNTDQSGISGIAADTNVKIMALKFLDSEGEGDIYSAISAYNYIYRAQQLGTNVVAVNNSWGGGDDADHILEKVIDLVGEAGAISVCAASNEGIDNDAEAVIPACIDSQYVISVAASTEKGELAEFSNYGATTVDLAAPGTNILSSVSYDCFNPSIYTEEELDTLCSYYTDFSDPFVECEKEDLDTVKVACGSFVYALEKNGEAAVSVTSSKDSYFGMPKEDAASICWKISDAQAGDSYTMYIPYDRQVSSTPLYESMMIRGEYPEQDEASINWPSTFLIYDESVTTGGAIASYDPEWDYVNGLYLFGKENYWTQLSCDTGAPVKKAGRYALILTVDVTTAGDYCIYLDDLGFSKENVEKEKFGKYAFCSGTSMAAPYVSGAVAVARAQYPKESASKLCKRVKGSATETEGLKGKVASNGTLDLTRLSSPNMIVSDTKMSDGVITVDGAFFGENPLVTINGEPVELIKKSDNVLSFAGKYDTVLDVEITGEGHRVSDSYFFPSGKESTKRGCITTFNWADGNMVTDGDLLYYVSSEGTVEMYEVDDSASYTNVYDMDSKTRLLPYMNGYSDASRFTMEKLFPEKNTDTIVSYSIQSIADAAVLQKDIYTAVKLDLGYYTDTALARWNSVESTWDYVADLPAEFDEVYKPVLGAYNGKLYLMGGYDLDNGKSLTAVYCITPGKSKNWKKVADLPVGVFHATALEAKDKLVVTLGGTGDETTTGNNNVCIFDGSKWTTGAALTGVLDTTVETVEIPYSSDLVNTEDVVVYPDVEWAFRNLRTYQAAVGNTDKGLIYAGIRVNGYGNVFYYNMSKDAYQKAGIHLTTMSEDDIVYGGTIGNTFYLLSGNSEVYYYEDEEDEDWEDWNYVRDGASTRNMQDTWEIPKAQAESDEYYYDYCALVSTIDVSHKTVEVQAKTQYSGGCIKGVGKYEPGETAKITAVAYKDYFVKQLYLNGKKVKNGHTFQVKDDSNQVSMKLGKYVTSVDLDDITLLAGETKKLKYEISPSGADNKKIKWASSNSSVVKVTQKGKITANAKAAGKSATITVTSADRNILVGICEVTVAKKISVTSVRLTAEKNTVKAGKTLQIKAQVAPLTASKKSMKWKSSNKKWATVSKKGKVKAKKKGKGHTVKITATSVSNPKVKGSIRIRIK